MPLLSVLELGLGLGAGVGGFAFWRRYGGGAALEQLERANTILTRRVGELEKQNREQATELAKLRVETNIALALAPVLGALKMHEERAADRADKTLGLLQLMADHLGRDADAAAA